MEFKLDPYHRNITESNLLDDLIETSKRLGKDYITQREYNVNGQYSSETVRKRFGSWKIAIKEAGLNTVHNFQKNSGDAFIEDIKRVAQLLKKQTLTKAEYDDLGKYSSSAIARRFGSWLVALKTAGLEKTRDYGLTEEELFSNLERVWRVLGRQPHYVEMHKPLSSYSVRTYEQRFGTWRNALEKFVACVNQEPRASILDDVEDHAKSKHKIDAGSKRIDKPKPPKKSRHISWRLRFLIMRRDGFRCCNCGRSPAMEPGIILHIDHNKAWSKDGPNTYDNLQTLCSVCNIGKSNLEPEEQ
jgi:5-methylcytosine-specific restriction endonuclease McrA